MDYTNYLSILGYFIGVVGAVTIIFSRVKNENLRDLKERVSILEGERIEYKQLLEAEREQSRQQHVANSKAIAALEKEVEIYKDLQLSSIATTNKQILETLQNSAAVLLTGTKTRAKAVEKVKTDLEHSNE